MNAITPLPRGQIISVPNMRVPSQGAQAAPFVLDFTNVTALDGDLQGSYQTGVFDFVQSVFIDNKDNSSTFSLVFPGAGPKGQTIQAQPNSQGYYPCSPVMGDGRFVASTSQGQLVPIIFYNIPMPYVTWGPVPGVLVVPALTNAALNLTPCIAGDNQLVAGAPLKTVKLYRGMFSVANPTVLKFTDGPAGTLLFAAQLTAGGSLTFQASGVPWLTGTVGKDLTLNSSAAVNMYGGYGYVQS